MKPSPLPRPCLDHPIEQTGKGSAPTSPQTGPVRVGGFQHISVPISHVMAKLAEKMSDV